MIRDLFGFSAILGVVLSLFLNLLVFEDWNVNYFQVASLQDLLVSGVYIGFILAILILPTPLIIISVLRFHVIFRVCRARILRRIRGRRGGVLDFILTYIYSASFLILIAIFLLYISILLTDFDFSIFQKFDSRNGRIAIFIYFAFLVPMSVFLIWPVKRWPVVPVFVIVFVYFIVWYFSFADTNKFRWYGFVSEGHIEISGFPITGCSKTFVLWIGERNTIVECWRIGRESEQQLFIVGNGSNLRIGPIQTDPPAQPPYYREGPLPPPEDRMTPEMKRAIGLQ